MMPGVLTIDDERFLSQQPNSIKTYPPQNSDADNKSPMVRRSNEDQLERIAEMLEKLPGSKNDLGAWSRTFATMGVVLLGWIFSALYIAKSTEAEIRISNAVLTEQLKQTRQDFETFRANSERDLKLLDERFRQISIAMEARHIRMPQQ